MLKLIDAAHFSDINNLSEVRTDGLSGIICKATDGNTFTDPTFVCRMTNLPGLGLVTGAYHFFRPLDNPWAQAMFFLSAIKPWMPLILALDLEWTAELTELEAWSTMDEQVREAKVVEFLSVLSRNISGKPHIYTSAAFMAEFLPHLDLSAYPLWVCDYNPAHQAPTLPTCWNTWSIWQQNARDREKGITGEEDLDIFNGDLPALQALRCANA